MFCGLLIHLLFLQSNSDRIFLAHVECLMLHILFYYIKFLHWIGFWGEMVLIRGLCCLVAHLLDNSCSFLPEKILVLRPIAYVSVLRYRSFFHHRTSYMYLSLAVPLFFHIILGMLCSMSILILQMSVCVEVCIFLMLPGSAQPIPYSHKRF